MHWAGEEYAVAITGVLFFAIVVVSLWRRFSMSAGSRLTFLAGAIACVGSATLLAHVDDVRYPFVVWALPVVPLIIIGVLVRDAVAWQPLGHATSASLEHQADAGAPSRPAFFPPADHPQSAEGGGGGEVRRKAADPHATPQDLAQIAFAHPQVRATVAINPATPANVLEWLASQEDPRAVAAIGAYSTTPLAD